ncbi:MAG: hypothetical protein ACPGNV_17495 [Mangrovicoccus sp.]
MADKPNSPKAPKQTGRRRGIWGVGLAEFLCLILAVAWLSFLLVVPSASGQSLGLIGTLLPFALLAAAVVMARMIRRLRQQANDLRAEMVRLRAEADTEPAGAPGSEQPSPPPAAQPFTPPAAPLQPPAHPLPPIGEDEGPPKFTSRRDLAEAASSKAELQLPLDPSMELEAPPLPLPEFIRALNFPETPEDLDGFRALRRALKDGASAPLIQASQDVLTLLSQDGIYMDDLPPDRARPELWRRFADGERGGMVGAIGGIRDRSSLAIAATRMREDPVFRDATHHFLRRFDKVLMTRVPDMDDASLIRMADTRSARAFMLLGRVVGIFS